MICLSKLTRALMKTRELILPYTSGCIVDVIAYNDVSYDVMTTSALDQG
jgi:hypothetical protein